MSVLNTKTILWDFDGTLAYREGLWTGTILSVLSKNNLNTIRKEEIRPFLSIGFPWNSPDASHEYLMKGKSWWNYMEDYFTEIFINVGLNNSVAKLLSKQVRDEYINAKYWHLFDDTLSALERIKKLGLENVIVSNHVPELKKIVAKLGIDVYFKEVFSSSIIGYDKPNKRIFDYALNYFGRTKNECVMIGDSYEADIAGALRAGLKAIFVRKSNEKSFQYYAKDLNDIENLILTI